MTDRPVAEPPRGDAEGGWLAALRRGRAARALERQLEYQRAKSARLQGRRDDVMQWMLGRSQAVRTRLEGLHPVPRDPRVLEVGSGAHGLAFFYGSPRAVGVDPLAAHYRELFPAWQGRVPTIAAGGEALPFASGAFDVVLCDNVIDHAEGPARIVAELARVLAPGGVLYFTVNVHHPLYGAVSRLHGLWNSLGVRLEITPFADHTVHLTGREARAMFHPHPLRIVHESLERRDPGRSRHAGDLVKRVFFKNALLEVIAVREPGA
jgi:SAM-dependent methyltransferase